MSKETVKGRPAPPPQRMAAKKGLPGRGPGFELVFEEGRGIVRITERFVEPMLRVEQIDLVIPDLAFPFDVSGGPGRFQNARLVFGRALVTIEEHLLLRAIEARLRPLGVEDVELRIDDGVLDVVVCGPATAGVSLAITVAADVEGDRDLLLVVDSPRAYGLLPQPVPVVAAQIVKTVAGDLGAPAGLGVVVPDPLKRVLLELLPPIGWRLPAMSDVRLSSVVLSGGMVQLAFHSPSAGLSPTESPPSAEALRRIEAARLTRAVEDRIAAGQLKDARDLALRLLERDPGHPRLVEILAHLWAADRETTETARAILSELPDERLGLGGRAILAAVNLRAGDTHGAAEQLHKLAEMEPSAIARVAAATAAAELLSAEHPEEAVHAYELALLVRRDDTKSLAALRGLYTRLGRKADLVRLGQRAAAAESAPQARAAAHLAVGQILMDDFDDAGAARDEFDKALRAAPDDVPALEALGEALRRLGEIELSVRTLDRAARAAEDNRDLPGAATAQLQAGRVWEEDLGDVTTATVRYRSATELDPTNAEAFLRLARASATLGRADAAARAYDRFLELGTRRVDAVHPEVVPALREMARLSAGALGAPEQAERYARAALARAPGDAESARVLEAALFVLERWEDLAEHHRRSVSAEPDRGAFHLRELARILDERLDRPAESVEVLKHAIAEAPEDLAIAEALAKTSRRAGDDALLRQALARLIEMRPTAAGRAEAHREMGELLLTRLASPDAAAEHLQAAVAEDPTDAVSLGYLVELHRKGNELLLLVNDLGRLAALHAAADRSEQAFECRIERGRILLRLGRDAEAAQCLEEAREVAPPPRRGEVLGILAEARRRAGDVAGARVAWAAAREDASAPPAAAIYALHEAECALQLGDPEGALPLLERAVKHAPAHEAEQALVHIIDLRLERGEVKDAAKMLESAAERAEQAARGAELFLRAAKLRIERLDDPRGAEATLKKLLRLEPKHAEALRVLLLLVRRRKDPRALAEILERLAELPEERRAALEELAPLYATELDDLERARTVYSRLYEADPRSTEALAFLARDALRRNDRKAAIQYYTALARTVPPAELAVEAYEQLAALKGQEGDLAGAVEAQRSALELWPDNRALCATLCDLLERASRHEELAEMLEKSAALAAEEDVAPTLRRLIGARRRLADPPATAEALRRLLAVEPDDVEALGLLGETYGEMQDPEGQAGVLRQLAQIQKDPRQAALFFVQASHLIKPEKGGVERAEALLREALERDAKNVDALVALETIYTERNDAPALAGVLGRAAAAVADPLARAQRLLRRAEILFESLNRPAEAMADARAAESVLPAEGAVLRARIARAARDSAAEAAALTDLLAIEAHQNDEAARRRLASLWMESLKRPEAALPHLEWLRQKLPRDGWVFETLNRALESLGHIEALAALSEEEAGRRTGDDAAALNATAAMLHLKAAERLKKSDLARAIQEADRALALDATLEGAAELLDQLLETAGRRPERVTRLVARSELVEGPARLLLLDRAAKIAEGEQAIEVDERLVSEDVVEAVGRLAGRYRQARMWDRLVGLLGSVASREADENRKSALLSEAGEAAELLGDAEQAEGFYREALLVRPTSPAALAGLVELLRRMERWGEVADTLEAVATELSEEERVPYLLRAAESREKDADLHGAIDAMERALRTAPEDRDVRARLAQLYRQTERWPDLVALLSAAADFETAAAARAQACYDAAEILAGPMADLKAAARFYERAAEAGASPVQREAARKARQAQVQIGDALGAIAALRREVAVAQASERAGLWIDLGRLEHKQGNLKEAIAAFESAVQAEPRRTDARRALGGLLIQAGQPARARPHLEAALREATEPADRATLLEALAPAAAADKRTEEAVRLFGELAKLRPQATEPHIELARLHQDAGRLRESVGALHAAADRTEAAADKATLFAQCGELLRDRMKNKKAAAEEFTRAAMLDPSRPQIVSVALALCRESGLLEDAARVLSSAIDQASSDADRHDLLLERARLRADALRDPDGALEDYLAAADAVAESQTALKAAALLAESLEKWDEAAAALGRLIALPQLAGAERADFLVRAGRLAERQGDPGTARSCYADALRLRGAPDATLTERLSALLDPTADRDELRALLTARLSALPASATAERLGIHQRLAQIAIESDDDDAAEENLRAILSLDSRDAASFGNLERLYRQRGRWRELRELCERRLKIVQDAWEKTTLLYEMAKLDQDQLGDPRRAAEAYRAALALDPEFLPALDGAAALAFAQGDWARARELYERLGDRGILSSDDVLTRRGLIAERLGDRAQALRSYEAALGKNASNFGAAEAMGRLKAALGDKEGAIEGLRRALDLAQADAERAGEVAAALCAVLLGAGRRDEARALVEDLRTRHPDSRPLTAAEVEIALGEERWQDAYDLLGAMLDRSSDAEERAAIVRRRAQLDRERLHPSRAPAAPAAAPRPAGAAIPIAPRPAPAAPTARAAAQSTSTVATGSRPVVEIPSADDFEPEVSIGPEEPEESAVPIDLPPDAPLPSPSAPMAPRAAGIVGSPAPPETRSAGAIVGSPAPEERPTPVPFAPTTPATTAFAQSALNEKPVLVVADVEALAELADKFEEIERASAARAILRFLDAEVDPDEPVPMLNSAPPDLAQAEALAPAAAKEPVARVLRRVAPFLVSGDTSPMLDAVAITRAPPVLQDTYRSVVEVVGLKEIVAYYAETGGANAELEFGLPPRVIVGRGLVGLGDGARRFAIARAVYRVSFGEGYVAHLGPDELVDRLLMLQEGGESGLEWRGDPDPQGTLAAMKTLPEPLREEAVEAAMNALRAGAVRAALVHSGDVAASLEQLLRSERPDLEVLPKDAAERLQLLQSVPIVRDLLRFCLFELPTPA